MQESMDDQVPQVIGERDFARLRLARHNTGGQGDVTKVIVGMPAGGEGEHIRGPFPAAEFGIQGRHGVVAGEQDRDDAGTTFVELFANGFNGLLVKSRQ